MRSTRLLALGATLAILGFLALAVEGLRVVVSDVSLDGWERAVPWAGLGLLALGGLLLLLTVLQTADDASPQLRRLSADETAQIDAENGHSTSEVEA